MILFRRYENCWFCQGIIIVLCSIFVDIWWYVIWLVKYFLLPVLSFSLATTLLFDIAWCLFLLSIGRALFLLSSFFFSSRSNTSCTSCCNKTWFVAFTFISFDKNYSGCLQWNEDFLCIKLYDVHKNENSNLILWFDILSIAFAE